MENGFFDNRSLKSTYIDLSIRQFFIGKMKEILWIMHFFGTMREYAQKCENMRKCGVIERSFQESLFVEEISKKNFLKNKKNFKRKFLWKIVEVKFFVEKKNSIIKG